MTRDAGGFVRTMVWVATCLSLLTAWGVAEEYYTEPQVYTSRPPIDNEREFGHIGATGIEARVFPGVELRVEGVAKGSPADGLIQKKDVILGVNGAALKGRNPFVALGEALTAAEASDGKMVFDVKRGQTEQKITVTIPVLGAYSDTFPLNCPKSKKIIEQASAFYSDYLSKHKGHDVEGGLAALFLLSTGDDTRLPIVKDYFHQFVGKDPGDNTWNNGYNGIACAEYYLRTGDKSVLPLLQAYADDAKARQKFGVGWTHWSNGISPRYVAGGLMNPAGSQVLTTLVLLKQCDGVNVDDPTLERSLRYFYRFVGHGTVPYGDHRSEGGLGSNGKDGMISATMQAATYARGDVSIYAAARDSLALSMLQSYPCIATGHADEGRGDGIWRGLSSAYIKDKKPELYRESMDRLKWWYDLSRFADGSMGVAVCTRFNDSGSGAGAMLGFTAPLKTLQITGAPRSKFAREFALPTHLWGRPADLEFFKLEPNPEYAKLGAPQPTHVPFFLLGSAYSKGKAETEKTVTREQMLQNAYHDNYMIRTQACKALRHAGFVADLEKLLADPDARVRRAALDGIIDWNYWFGMGKEPLKPEQYTPAMVEMITKMLRDPNEALYVVDGALFAMSNAPAQTIWDNRDVIIPWTTSDDWWLRESSFMALQGLSKNESLYEEELPRLIEMVIKEYHTMPRERMTGAFKKVFKSLNPDGASRKMILAGFQRSIMESEVKGAPYTGEGAYNVLMSIRQCLELDPNAALATAEALRARIEMIDTGSLIGLLSANDEGTKGLFDSLGVVSAEDKAKLTDLLYNVYRPELVKRMESEQGVNLALIDTIIALKRLKSDITGWQPIGSPEPAQRVWQYTTLDATTEADQMHPREHKRFRDITLPGNLTGWFKPEYQPSDWKTGKAPIGKGIFGKEATMTPNQTDWGDGEFLLARTTFTVEDVDCDLYRICFLSNQGFRVYLNGTPIETYIWWSDNNGYQHRNIEPNDVKLLKKGVNTLAVYTNCEYPAAMKPHRKDQQEVLGQMQFFIEGLRLKEIKD